MKIFIHGFVDCTDYATNNVIQGVFMSGNRPDNLEFVFVASNCENIYPYGTPQEFGSTGFPEAFFLAEYEEGKYTVVDKLSGSNITDELIRSKLALLANQPQPDRPGQGGIIPTDNEAGGGFGFGDGTGGKWFLYILAAAAGYKALTSKKGMPQYGFGVASFYFISMALKK